VALGRIADRDFGSLLDEDDGQARILAERDPFVRCDGGVFEQLGEDLRGARIGFRRSGPFERRPDVVGQLVAGRDAQRLDGPDDLFEFDGSHGGHGPRCVTVAEEPAC